MDVSTKQWKEIVPEGPLRPEPRSSAYLTAMSNKLYLFGGCNGRQTFADLHTFDLSSSTWSKVDTSGDIPRGLVGLMAPPSPAEATSNRPLAARQGKRLHYLHEDFMSGRYTHRQLDLVTFRWTTDGKVRRHPKIRRGSSLMLHSGNLLLTGGATDSGKPAGLTRLDLSGKQFSWCKERILWLACFKNSPDDCLLAKCPPIVIYQILTHLNKESGR